MKIRKRSKPIVASKDNTDLSFSSVQEAAEKLNIGMTGIYKVLRGERSSSNGYSFRFDEDLLPGEMFKKHPTLDLYVSDFGRVINPISKTKTYGWGTEAGYRRFTYLGKSFHVHRLVCETFHKNENMKPVVDHINRIRDDNRAVNLRWVDHVENSKNRKNQSAYQHNCPTCSCFK